MSDRIRQLEDALAILQSSNSREPHPLLRRELLGIKSGLHLHSAQRDPGKGQEQGTAEAESTQDSQLDEQSQEIDAFGTLAVRDDGVATFYGRSAGSEVGFVCCDLPLHSLIYVGLSIAESLVGKWPVYHSGITTAIIVQSAKAATVETGSSRRDQRLHLAPDT